MLSRLFMRITGLRTSGIEIPEGENEEARLPSFDAEMPGFLRTSGIEIPEGENEDARLPSFDAGVRGFTGLLVGFLAGMATWSLAFIIWWLV